MISALLVHRPPQPALALGLARLVEGALAGLLADVAILDLGSDPLVDKLAEDGGCAVWRPEGAGMAARRAVAATALARMKAEWALILPSDLAPAKGWVAAARETLALVEAGADVAALALLTPPAGLLRRRRAVALTRRAALSADGLILADPADAALRAAARLGRTRRLERGATREG